MRIAADDDAQVEARNALFGDGPYEAAGRPFFTRLFTYDELLTIERPQGRLKRKQKGEHEDFKRPDNWPDDTQVDTGSWVFWLPEGWAQGIRTQVSSGKTLTCYMTPEGKRFWHKKRIEEYLGRKLPTMEPPPKVVKEDGEEVKIIRRVTDPDAIPNWPDDEDHWLPTDFKIAFRQLPGGLHRIYVPPGYDDEGFLYHRSTVKEWLEGTLTKVTPFDGSRFSGGTEGCSLSDLLRPKKSMRRDPDAQLGDFEDCEGLKIVDMGAADVSFEKLVEGAGASSSATRAGEAQQIQKMLRLRGMKDAGLLYVAFERDGRKHHAVTEGMSGFFYRMLAEWNGAPIYQHIRIFPEGYGGVACTGLYVSRTTTCGPFDRWRIGSLSDGLNGTAALCEGKDMVGRWSVRRRPGGP